KRFEENEFQKIFDTAINKLVNLDRQKVNKIENTDELTNQKLNDCFLGDLLDSKFQLICKGLIVLELKNIQKSITSSLNEIGYLEGVRANSQRIYTNKSQGTNFNSLLLNVTQNKSLKQENARVENFVNK